MVLLITFKIIKIMNKHLLLFCCLCIILFLVSCEKFIDVPTDKYNEMNTEEAVYECLNGSYAMLSDAIKMYNLLSVKSDDINLQTQTGAELSIISPANSFASDFITYNYIRWVQTGLGAYSGEHMDNREFEGMWIFTKIGCSPAYTDISTEFYRLMYRAILMANKIIDNVSVEEKKEKWPVYLGEAYFLRAYLYFKLVRVFGRIPLVTDIHVNYEIPLAEFLEIYSQIESDLKAAVLYLPQNRYVSRKGTQTPHQGTVKALLAEVYLSMGGFPLNDPAGYTKAAEIAREVIENADLYGFGLVDDFANLWQWDHHDNEESIWSIYYRGETYNPENKLPIHIIESNIQSNINKISTDKHFLIAFPNNYRKEMTFWHYGCFELNYLDDVLPEDYEFLPEDFDVYSETKNKAYYLFEDVENIETDFYSTGNFFGNAIGKKQTVNFSCYSNSMIKTLYPPYKIILERAKYAISNNLDYSDDLESYGSSLYSYLNNNLINEEFNPEYEQFFHIFRYAHTLLTYAEAKARSGNPDAMAYEAVNMIRRRSYKLPVNEPSIYDMPQGLSAMAFADSVVAERGWEFCHELEGRWNDIIRLQLYPQVEINRDSYSYSSPILIPGFESKKNNFSLNTSVEKVYNGQTYFIPLPDEDFWLNPNLEETANDSIY